MDLKYASESITASKNAIFDIMRRIPFTDHPDEKKLIKFLEVCRDTCNNSHFVVSKLKWLESLEIMELTRGMTEICVEIPDFSSMKWLSERKYVKPEGYITDLDELLDDIRNLEMPSSMDKPEWVNIDKCDLSYGQSDGTVKREGILPLPLRIVRTPNISECSSIEIIDYDLENSGGTITPEDSTHDSISSSSGSKISGHDIIKPTFQKTELLLSDWLNSETLTKVPTWKTQNFKRVKNQYGIEMDELPLMDMLLTFDNILNTDDSSWLISHSKTVKNPYRDTIPNDSSLTSTNSLSGGFDMSSRCGLKRKSDHPCQYSISQIRTTELSEWLAPPIMVNDRIGNPQNNYQQDTRRCWLADNNGRKSNRSQRLYKNKGHKQKS